MKFIKIVFAFILISQICADDFDSNYFFKQYDKYRLTPDNLMLMNHDYIIEQLNKIDFMHPDINLQKIGESVEKRSINMFTFGQGKSKFLLWSQMHGDEPTATAALLAIFHYFAKNFDNPFVQQIYNNIEINAIIMLNPDGAQRFKRRNAMDIDINRDARLLQTPEGRILKAMKEKIDPDYGFNLHDMYGRESVGDTRKVLKIALMAPPFNEKNEDSESRIRAKKMAVLIKQTLDLFAEGHIAKYKAGYMPRAFGDAMQNWGVSTVLIESGRFNYQDPREIVRLNFVALLAAFHSVARDSLEKIDASLYDNIPLEGVSLYDLLIKDITIYNGIKEKAFFGNIGINIHHSMKNGVVMTRGVIKDIGDLMTTTGIEVIEEPDLIATPGFIIKKEKLDQNRTELMKNGITTVVTYDDKPVAELTDFIIGCPNKVMKKINSTGIDKTINHKNISRLTAEFADKLDLQDRGQIKIDYKADLLLFQQKNNENLYLDSLKYVIKNGSIFELRHNKSQ